MCCKSNILYFLAGAAAMHTINHIGLQYGLLPMTVWGIAFTTQLNTYVILGSGLLTLVLLYFAGSEKDRCKAKCKEEIERK